MTSLASTPTILIRQRQRLMLAAVVLAQAALAMRAAEERAAQGRRDSTLADLISLTLVEAADKAEAASGIFSPACSADVAALVLPWRHSRSAAPILNIR